MKLESDTEQQEQYQETPKQSKEAKRQFIATFIMEWYILSLFDSKDTAENETRLWK